MHADTLILGAGVIGSALAMALAEKGAQNILVVDPDLEGSFSSSELNAGGVRATFNQEINVLSSKISIEYFAQHREALGFRESGYLWLHTPEAYTKAMQDREKWDRLGWKTEAWSVDQLRSKRPFIDLTSDLGGAIFSPRDGLINSNLLKLHFRNEAKKRGVQFIDRLSLENASLDRTGWKVQFYSLLSALSEDQRRAYFSNPDIASDLATNDQLKTITADRVVNCAGPWAKPVARILGYGSPTFASRRQISFFDSRDVNISDYGMMVNTNGVYFHPEATKMVGGYNIGQEPEGFNFQYGGEEFFQEYIWAPLSERSTKFEALRHISGWAGLYEVSPDESAIVGEVSHSSQTRGRLFESHSYSGHGVMHSYANGQALAEKILNGKYATDLDLEILSGDRFKKNQLVHESAVI